MFKIEYSNDIEVHLGLVGRTERKFRMALSTVFQDPGNLDRHNQLAVEHQELLKMRSHKPSEKVSVVVGSLRIPVNVALARRIGLVGA